MYNIAIAVIVALVTFLLISFGMGWKVAIVPALFVGGVSFFFLARRVGNLVQPELDAAIALLQGGKVDEGRAKIEALKQRWGPWQLLLADQLDAQLGMLDYMQMKWDEAYPRLDRGKWRNWAALTCLACIHWRREDRKKAFELLEKAADASPKESMVYVVWATLLQKADQRDKALVALDKGLKENPDSAVLKELHGTIANKRKVDTKSFPQTWYQFFPEDLAAQYMIKGRKDGQMPALPSGPGTPAKPTNRKMRRQGK